MNLLNRKAIVISLFCLTMISLATAQNFAPATSYPTGMLPEGSAAADFNNDGNVDVVVGNTGTTTLSLFLGQGNGTLNSPSTIQLGIQPFALATADFNGDGNVDIAVAGVGGPFFQVLLGNGDGTFQAPIDVAVPGISGTFGVFVIADIAVGDLNGDKKTDIVVATSNGAAVFLNQGAGNFAFSGNVLPGQVLQNVGLADFNRDGTLDLISIITLGGGSPNTFLSLGRGDGTFAAPSALPIVPTNPDGLAIADLNQDGLPDVIVDDNGAPGATSGAILIALQNPDGSFASAGSLSIPGPTGLVAADIDGDGDIDVAATTETVNGNQNFIEVFHGNGNGTFSAPVLFPVAAGAIHPIAAHLTNKSAFDLISSALSANEISVLVNHGANTLTLLSSANPSTIGQPVLLTATVRPTFSGSGALSGSLIFADGNKTLGTSAVNSSGSGSLNTTFSSVGNHPLLAVFSGNASFVSSSASITQVVNKASPAVTLSSSNNPSLFGQSITFSVTVSGAAGAPAPTGTVNLLDGSSIILSGVLDNAGKAAFSTSSLAVGSHALTAQYSGDANNGSATSPTLTQQVNKTSSATSLTAAPNPSAFGQAVTLTAIVSGSNGAAGTPTGSVSFSDGTTAIGTSTIDANGKGTLTISSLSVGTHSITATYNGDSNFAGSTSPLVTQIVNKGSSSTTLSASPNPSNVGEAVTLSVTVNGQGGTPTGTVSFNDGTTALGTVSLDSGGKAVLSVSSLGVGTHSLIANYPGDGNFAGSSSAAVSQVVNKVTSVTTLTAAPNPSVFGQAVSLTGSVVAFSGSSPLPTGTVTFTDGTITLGAVPLDSTGKAILSISSLSVGAHSITASYSGDGNFSASTSSLLTETVSKSPSSTTLASSPNPSVFGQSIVLTATITASGGGAGIPSGSVVFMDGSAAIGSAALDKSGKATLTLNSLALGTHSISANYGGDTNFNPSAAAGGAGVSQVVSQSSTGTSFSSSANPSVFGQQVTLTATVTATGGGGGTPSGSVTFMDGAQSIGVATLDSNGIASLTISSLSVGTHNLSANYQGSVNYLPSGSSLSQTVNKNSVSITLTSVPNPSTFGQTITFTVKVVPSPPGGAPGTAPPGGSITFSDGTSILGTVALDNNGAATFTTSSLTAGSHTITATYGGDANFSEGSSSETQAVQKVPTRISLATSMNPTTNTSTITLTASVVGNGNPSGNVILSDAGLQVGSSQIDNAGNAVFTVANLSPGTHTLVASYAGENNFAGSQSAPLVETVVESRNTIALSSSANPQTVTKAITFSAVVTTSSGGPVNAGTVTFTIGSSVLATVPVTNSGAIFTTDSLPVGHDLITASYQAGSAPGPSDNSATLTEIIDQATPTLGGGGNNEDFTISVQPDNIQVKAGNAISTDVVLVPVNGFTGTVSVLCADVPAESTCIFSPNAPALDGKNPLTVTVQITTSGHAGAAPAPTPHRMRKEREARGSLMWFPVLPIAFGGILIPKRRKKRSRMIAITLLAGCLIGCGGTTFDTVPLASNTPRGNYTVSIQATSGPLVHSAQIHLTVE